VNEGQQLNKNFDMLENYGSICMTQKPYLLMVPSVTVCYCGYLHTDRLNVKE
jgi:thioredoxin-related protein